MFIYIQIRFRPKLLISARFLNISPCIVIFSVLNPMKLLCYLKTLDLYLFQLIFRGVYKLGDSFYNTGIYSHYVHIRWKVLKIRFFRKWKNNVYNILTSSPSTYRNIVQILSFQCENPFQKIWVIHFRNNSMFHSCNALNFKYNLVSMFDLQLPRFISLCRFYLFQILHNFYLNLIWGGTKHTLV